MLPAILIPIGLTIVGVLWLLSDDAGADEDVESFEDEFEGDGF